MTKVSNMIPSVLVECGFMTNKEELAKIWLENRTRIKCIRKSPSVWRGFFNGYGPMFSF
jgi:hypothetical protein